MSPSISHKLLKSHEHLCFSFCSINNEISSVSSHYTNFIFTKVSLVLSVLCHFLPFSPQCRECLFAEDSIRISVVLYFHFLPHINSLSSIIIQYSQLFLLFLLFHSSFTFAFPNTHFCRSQVLNFQSYQFAASVTQRP